MDERSKKAQETRQRKLEAAMEDLGIEKRAPKKPKRKRKPMTEEQKKAAVERLAKARAAKGTSNSSVHPECLKYDEDSPFHIDKVKGWLKYNKDYLASINGYANSKDSKERSEYQGISTYVKNLQDYLRTGVYNDFFYGEKRDHRIGYVCIAKAYDKNGNVKRTKNTWYNDIGWYEKEET